MCAIYSPDTKVSIKVNSTDTKITSLDIKWVITKDFTNQLKQVYDTNLDNKIDKDELKFVKKALIDYAKYKNYMTSISYGEIINKEKSDNFTVTKQRVDIENGFLHFFYTINVDYDIKNDYSLYVHLNDDENYFALLLENDFISFRNKAKISKITDKQSVIFLINNAHIPKKIEKEKKEEKEKIVQEKKEVVKKSNTQVQNSSLQFSLLKKFVEKVKKYLLEVQKGNSFALFTLLFVSFLYGVIHALGPGHGKTLAFSYFSTKKSSYKKAFGISLASSFLHIIGALILVCISVFILETVLSNFVKDTVKILTQISAVMIMLLAFYIFLQKMNNKGCGCSSCSSTNQQGITWNNTNSINLKNNDNIDFKKVNKKRSDLYFILTAGLIPCPGTVILFIYAFILKTYFAVLLASVAISFGMAVVIFASSFLGVSLHKISSKSHKLTNILEIGSPIVMFILGLLLLFSSNSL
ncbi:nickel/cobalt transporter [Arcobacter sp. CECT 8985]|uniref:nickel/cobalt transporter n=1 Tax=Arcobacter sp. CECT 8985 TaxID=1935424 RepID=UPI002159CB4F|nr:hypothetical protein [Arcobacter sp. CECT 8985]